MVMLKNINPEGDENTYTYDAHGNVLSVTDGNDVTTSSALPSGRLLLPDLSNLIYDTMTVIALPFNTYFWSVQAVDPR